VRNRHLHLVSWLFVLFALTARLAPAETPNYGINIQPEAPAPKVELASPGEVDPGKAPTAPKVDRKESQAMAAAMAAQAAAMQNISCMMMMNEAMKKDDKMMMAMAMQQCAQAAQTMANAAENRKNKDKVEADPGKPASYKAGDFKAPQQAKDPESVDFAAAAAQNTSGESTIAPDPEVATLPDVPSFMPSPTPAVAEATPAPVITGEPVPGGIPNTIERARLGYDETGKSGAGATPDRALGSNTSIATSKPGSDPQPVKGENITSLGGQAGRGRKPSSIDDSAGSGGSEEKSGDGSSPLDAMLATLLGGSQPSEAESASNGDQIAAVETAQENGKATPNIFEYATYRYRKVTYDEGKIKVRRPKEPLAPSTAASTTTAMAVGKHTH